MRIGLEFGDFAWDGGPSAMADTVVRFARTADESGVALLGVGDHLWQGPHAGGPESPQLECFTTLALMAAYTQRCQLAPIVAGVHFRAPAVLVKTVTTLDILSGGRAVLGIGAGWDADEAAGMGVEFPPVGARFEMLEEALRICRQLWDGERGDEKPFAGVHYRLERALNMPQSLSRPHPPILIGGGGKRTLRLVAQYGDACNLYPTPDLAEKLALLREYCDEYGRDYESIEKTCILPFSVNADGSGTGELVDFLGNLGQLGIQLAIGIVNGADPVRTAEVVGEKVVAEVASF
ncbi:TIGR03560 family F420-dependent LLM class oxidoreductase [Actinokineospora sp. 24-640]